MQVSRSNGLLTSRRLEALHDFRTGACIGSNLPDRVLPSSRDGVKRSDAGGDARGDASGDARGGVVESIIGIFLPYTRIGRQVQAAFNLERTPGCRADHGRFELLIRGAGMTDRPLEERVALAHQLTDVVRPLLRAERKRQLRRFGERAIAIAYEDEQVEANGIATSRFTYVGSVEHDPDEALRRALGQDREKRRRSR